LALGIVATIAVVAALIYRFARGEAAVYHVGLIVCLAAVISMCFDVLSNQGRVPDTAWEALVYVAFFPIMPAGPFVRYGDFIEKLDKLEFSTENLLKGIVRFVLGFIKCVAISAVLGRVYDETMALCGGFGLSVYIFLAAICGVRIYTFFSGYSDMGRGIALMLGIDIKKDFGDPFLNSTPVNYIKRLFRSLSEFCKLYIVSPINRLFGYRMIGKIVACAAAGCYYVFLVCKTPEMALILFLPFAILSYFVMYRSRVNRGVKPMWRRLLGTLLTFALSSVVWMLISLGSLAEIGEAISHIIEIPVFHAEYRVLSTIASYKNMIVPTVSGVLVFVISKILLADGVEREGDISVKTLVVRSVALTLLAIMFVLTVIALLPQFPDVVSYANVFHFV
jgi:D-alanyl-lipoteichoic acid acyltransferase DltB (MBOAT superfamily)